MNYRLQQPERSKISQLNCDLQQNRTGTGNTSSHVESKQRGGTIQAASHVTHSDCYVTITVLPDKQNEERWRNSPLHQEEKRTVRAFSHCKKDIRRQEPEKLTRQLVLPRGGCHHYQSSKVVLKAHSYQFALRSPLSNIDYHQTSNLCSH